MTAVDIWIGEDIDIGGIEEAHVLPGKHVIARSWDSNPNACVWMPAHPELSDAEVADYALSVLEHRIQKGQANP
jgi:hypothetical protein